MQCCPAVSLQPGKQSVDGAPLWVSILAPGGGLTLWKNLSILCIRPNHSCWKPAICLLSSSLHRRAMNQALLLYLAADSCFIWCLLKELKGVYCGKYTDKVAHKSVSKSQTGL